MVLFDQGQDIHDLVLAPKRPAMVFLAYKRDIFHDTVRSRGRPRAQERFGRFFWKTKTKSCNKCSCGPSSFYALNDSLGEFDSSEILALLVETIPGQLRVFWWPQFSRWPNKYFEKSYNFFLDSTVLDCCSEKILIWPPKNCDHRKMRRYP